MIKQQDKISDLSATGGSYSLIDKKERDFILKNIDKENFKEEIEDYLFKKYREYDVKDIFDYLNHDYLLLLDYKDKEILDIGCGEGTSSLFFAKYGAKKVFSLEINPDRLNMLVANAKKLKINDKIIPLLGDFTKCKIKDSSFDIITMIGVLEWLPKLNPYKEYLCYLNKVRKALKQNGKLIVAIENRFNPLYFIGRTHHGDIPFMPLIPTFISNIITKIVKGKPYTAHTYTDSGYLKLFKKAGFKNIKIYPVFPAYQEPRFVINSIYLYKNVLKKYGLNWFMNLGATILSLFPTFILKKLVPAYVIIGEK